MQGRQPRRVVAEGWIGLLQVLSVVVSLLASFDAFFLWAYAGSDDFDVLITFGIAPWVATFFIFTRRLVAGSVAYLIAASAFILAALFRERWGSVSVLVATVPLGMSAFSAVISAKRAGGEP